METIAFFVLLSLGLFGWYGMMHWDRHNAWWMRAAAVLCFFGLTGAGRWLPDLTRIERERTATVYHPSSTVNGSPSTVASFTVYRQPSLVGSSIKETYHLATCRYADLMEHSKEYDSHDQARADGKRPCKICLGDE